MAHDIKLHNFMAIAFLKQDACNVAYTRLAKQNEAVPVLKLSVLRLRMRMCGRQQRDVEPNSLVPSWQALHVPHSDTERCHSQMQIKLPQTNVH